MLAFFKKLFKNNKKQGYYFIHIPKTAGTSFISLLDRCVDEDEIFPCQLWQQVNQEIVDNKSQYQLLRGHFGGGAYKLLCNNNPHLLTILRHPLNLSISTYHFIKREKNTAVHDLVKSRGMNLLEFLQEPLTAQKINNRMVRHLSFDLQSDPEAQELFLSRASIEVVSRWIKTPKKISNQKRLERAKKLLMQCSWFGIQEQFDKSMQLFAYEFHLPPIGKTSKLNTHNPNQEIDNTCKGLINEQNQYDLSLYRTALSVFEQRYQTMCDKLAATFNQQCTADNIDILLDKNYQASVKEPLSKQILYDFSEKLVGSGWHRRERAMPEKSYFRWTNSCAAFIDFNLPSKNYELSIRFINAVSSEHLDNLELWVNNEIIEYNYDNNSSIVRILSAKIEQTKNTQNRLRIQFKHKQALKHSEVFASDDTRSLGIAVNWIKISPCKL